FEDAERAAPILDVTLTTRSKKDEVPIPMCGVPHFAVQSYVAKLLAAGLKVALCDQMEDPATARGLVERAVVRVITPGTVTEEECLDPKCPNYLSAVTADGQQVVLAAVDLSTGELRLVTLADEAALADELTRLAPREVLVPADDTALSSRVAKSVPQALVNTLPLEHFAPGRAEEWLRERGAAATNFNPAALGGLAALLWYLEQTHRAGVAHLRLPEVLGGSDRLLLDQATRRNLELLSTMRGELRGSLLWVLDQTLTPMGGRLLRQWLLTPLTDLAQIGERLDAVEHLREHPSVRQHLEAELRAVGDLERLNGRLAAARVTPRDVVGLAATLERVERLRAALAEVTVPALQRSVGDLDAMPDIRAHIAAVLAD